MLEVKKRGEGNATFPSDQRRRVGAAPFQRGGAAISIGRATAIWRSSQRDRGDVVSIRAAWIDLVEHDLVVGRLVFASFARTSYHPYDGAIREKSLR